MGTTSGGLGLGLAIATAWFALARFADARTGLVLGVAAISMIGLTWPPSARWLPERSCQVQRRRLATWTRERAALHWGMELGLGFCTFLVTPAMYALPAVGLAQASPLRAIVVCAAYGWSRGATIAIFALFHGRREARGGDPLLSNVGNFRGALRPLLGAAVLATTVLLIT